MIRQTMAQVELKWRQALGDDVYGGLSHALEQLQAVLDDQQPSRGGAGYGV